MDKVNVSADGDALKVTSYKLAKYWTDAYPIGNGSFGAMVWGGAPSELLQLNGNMSPCS